jgi:hypothetical protein
MTDRVQLGWRVPQDTWERFVTYVHEKHNAEGVYIRVEIEAAMIEFLDKDEILAEAEELLREEADGRGLSSSTVHATDRYQGCTTKLVNNRIRAQLKEEFKIFADKHDASSYGRLLAAALDSYVDGGRARRILEGVKRAVEDATNTGSTDGYVENSTATSVSTDADRGDNDSGVETKSLIESGGATGSSSTSSVDVDPLVVENAVDELLDQYSTDIESLKTFPQSVLDESIKTVTGQIDHELIGDYRERVLEELPAEEHPHVDEMYITEYGREEQTLWDDLDKSERIELLRRWVVEDAIQDGQQKKSFTYKKIMSLFEDKTMVEPSTQYAYDAMDAAADKAGFNYKEFKIGTEASEYQLRVDVSSVGSVVLDWIRDETQCDPDRIRRLADITLPVAGSVSEESEAADD